MSRYCLLALRIRFGTAVGAPGGAGSLPFGASLARRCAIRPERYNGLMSRKAQPPTDLT